MFTECLAVILLQTRPSPPPHSLRKNRIPMWTAIMFCFPLFRVYAPAIDQ